MQPILILFALLLATSGTAIAEPTAELESLLATRDYRTLAERIDRQSNSEEEVVSWLRSHSNEWHPPIFYALSNKLLSRAMGDLQSKSVTKTVFETIGEMAQAYARGKTSFQVELADCVTKSSATLNYWLRRNSDLSLGAEVMLSRSRESTVLAAEQSVLWAGQIIAQEAANPTTRPPPAVWLCGEGNVLQESERIAARTKAFKTVAEQVSRLKMSSAPNQSFQGTLRDKAAQRP